MFLFCALTFLEFYCCHHWLLVFYLKLKTKTIPSPSVCIFKKNNNELERDETLEKTDTLRTKKQTQLEPKIFVIFPGPCGLYMGF